MTLLLIADNETYQIVTQHTLVAATGYVTVTLIEVMPIYS